MPWWSGGRRVRLTSCHWRGTGLREPPFAGGHRGSALSRIESHLPPYCSGSVSPERLEAKMQAILLASRVTPGPSVALRPPLATLPSAW